MATTRYNPPDLRRQLGSPRPKPRDNRDTLCRNVVIYGHCRYEDTCAFNHDPKSKSSTNSDMSSRKALNVESPSFTPASLQQQYPQQPPPPPPPPPPSQQQQPPPPQQSQQPKKSTFSSQAISSAVFTPRGPGAVTPIPPEADAAVYNPATVKEFTPQPHQNYELGATNGTSADPAAHYDPFNMAAVGHSLPAAASYNPYATADQGGLAAHGAAFFPGQSAYPAHHQPLNYHMYYPAGPHRQDLAPYHRATHDFFLPEKLREDMQKKAQAGLQIMPNSVHLDNYHSLVTLDTTGRKMGGGVFGYVSWVYKAVANKNGRTYCLRRLEGYRLTNEQAMRPVKEWRKINNGNIVTIHEVFTSRAFGDSSLVFAQDYYPLSKTLAEHHFPSGGHAGRFRGNPNIQERDLWGYIVQISNAIKAVHTLNLAVRCLDLSKIILTDKHRIRLTGCGILDVVQYEAGKALAELQQDDFMQFGRIILSLATNTPPHQLTNLAAAMEHLERTYSSELAGMVTWLINPTTQKNADSLTSGISNRMTAAFDMALHRADGLHAELFKEIENGRLARLLLKLGTINERQEFDGDSKWAEHGDRYQLKLFRDYVFHQVDENGNPVIDMGHMLRSLAKLDAGTSELIRLTSRDGLTDFLVTYKELNKLLQTAFGELLHHKPSRGGGGGGASGSGGGGGGGGGGGAHHSI